MFFILKIKLILIEMLSIYLKWRDILSIKVYVKLIRIFRNFDLKTI